ncbi:MAG: DUF2332 domain-containing protein [Myxococcales bacterium]|nr:DUF2332 domain-containing protein [Myxococcales bacterium]
MIDASVKQVAARFIQFAEETHGSSPLYETLSRSVSLDLEVAALLLAAAPSQQRPNLLFAAVHDLLLSGMSHPLAAYYPSITATSLPADRTTIGHFRDFCLSHRSQLTERIETRHTQTNEVRRSIALLPIMQQMSLDGPIALVEVGASAGLNLLVDRYRYRYGVGAWVGAPDSSVAIECESRGHAVPFQVDPPRIGYRLGLDSHPLDATRADDARWLMACVWPEHLERQSLLSAALGVARTHPPRLIAGDAIHALEATIAEVPDHLPICLFHSATAAYFTDSECAAFASTIDRIASQRPLHWVSLEGGAVQSFGARLPFERLFSRRANDLPTDIFGLLGHATWRDGHRTDELLARVDMHGRWIEWLIA